jgi:hypothetical protein
MVVATASLFFWKITSALAKECPHQTGWRRSWKGSRGQGADWSGEKKMAATTPSLCLLIYTFLFVGSLIVTVQYLLNSVLNSIFSFGG